MTISVMRNNFERTVINPSSVHAIEETRQFPQESTIGKELNNRGD